MLNGPMDGLGGSTLPSAAARPGLRRRHPLCDLVLVHYGFDI